MGALFIKNGVLDGGLKWLGFSGGPELLYTPGAILFGMIYVYLPFMLFPMSLGIAMIPGTSSMRPAILGLIG